MDNSCSLKFLKLFTRNRPKALDLLENACYKLELVNECYCDGRTCAHIAAQDGDHRFLRKIIEEGGKVWSQTMDHLYPLHLAVKESNTKAVRVILESEVPMGVIEYISINSNYDAHHCECFFYEAIHLDESTILKELINKFFPLIQEQDILKIVKYAIRRYGAEMAYDVMRLSPKAVEAFRDVGCLRYTLESDDDETPSIKFLLQKGEHGYPIDLSKHHDSLEGYMDDEECKVLRYFVQHKDKVKNLSDPHLLLYAINAHNPNAVDILLALGCDPHTHIQNKRIYCFTQSLGLCITNARKRDISFVILRKILLYKGSSYFYRIVKSMWNPSYIYAAEYHKAARKIISDFYEGVTLFDMIEYHLRISDIRSNISANIKVKCKNL